MDVESAEFKAALRDHARSLGVDPDAEPQLLSIVQDALLAELPDGWEQGETEDGTPYYFNTATEQSIWEHPLDAHYREVIKAAKASSSSTTTTSSSSSSSSGAGKDKGKQEQQQTTPATASDAVSSLEVYSFDDVDSDDEVVPPKKPEPTSRIASLFSQSTTTATAAATTAAATVDAGSSSRSSSRSAAVTSKPAASSSTSGGFGRDRSWLLDDSDDAVAPLKPSVVESVAPKPAPLSSAASLTATASRASSTLSFTSRLFGTSSSSSASTASSVSAAAAAAASSNVTSSLPSASSSSTTTSAANASSASPSSSSAATPDLVLTAASPSSSPKQSPRRGLAATIKSPFFQDVAASTLSSSFTSTAPSTATAASTAAAANSEATAKISALEKRVQELEKTNGDLERRLKEQQRQLETLRSELDVAKQDAKEANYLKMKANEHKSKLSERDAELARAKDELSKQATAAQELQRQLDRALSSQQQQSSASTQELQDAKKTAAALQTELSTSHAQVASLEAALEQAKSSLRDAEARAKEAALVHARDRSALEQQLVNETAALKEQLESSRREMEDHGRRADSLSVLQETLERQSKHVKELEDKLKDGAQRLEQSEAREAATRRELQQQQLELEAMTRKLASVQSESEARERLLRETEERLRAAQSELQDASTRSLSRQRVEQDAERQRQALEQDRLALVAQLREKSETVVALQQQLKRAQEQAQSATTTADLELQDLRAQLQAMRTQHVLPLEKARDQLESENARALERLATLDKELRAARHELSTEATRSHQLTVEVEAWKRREQQHKTQRDAAVQDRQRLEKELAALEADAAAFKHERRLESEKLAFRQRELESLVAQKDYEIVRVEERFAKAEAWRLKEARRVEERDAQLLALREELAQLRARHVEQENSVIVQELRREKDALETRVRQLSAELEETRVARELAAQRWQDEAEATKKALEWQLPQLAAACVSRSSEEWAKKCQQLTQALRDELQLQALTERNALLRRVADAEDAREHVEAKYKTVVAECEFLRKEVHRVEDNNKVLIEQLHTIRVYLTQYRGGFATAAAATAPAPAAMSPPMAAAPVAPAPAPTSFHAFVPPVATSPPSAFVSMPSDFATVNHLNAQLALLHAQFQQLFDATDDSSSSRRMTTTMTPLRFSPSDRFEMPPPSPVRPTRRTSGSVSVSDGNETRAPVDVLGIEDPLGQRREQQQREKEELLASLEALGAETSSSSSQQRPPRDPDVDALVTASSWYRRDYWRDKYTS